MNKKQRGLLAVFILVVSTMLVSSCTQSLSSAPAATPTLLPEGLFVSPFPSVENPMAMIEEFAKQTAAAQTSAAGGDPAAEGTEVTPDANENESETPTPDLISTPTNAEPGAAAAADTAIPAATSIPGVRPATYTLQKGEFPYCIARRFNVDPATLLSLSGLTSAQANSLVTGTVLTIPQSGNFPGNRALAPHPTTYTVLSGDETVYGVACKFGDVDPAVIAAENSIAISAKLTAGQQLRIP
ncbi:MAG: LysM peptidoglycan-binding domain-containing protein [Anaerolineales bacterium]|nr:MAG: LysM peptidoglycan-binding domain-containing protein [Anaerolineales bacterium]